MNENKGAKGGSRDHKRSLMIKKNQKTKLQKDQQKRQQERIRKLEKEVRNLQIATFLSAVPLVIAGKTIETIMSASKKEQKQGTSKKEQPKELENLNKIEEKKNFSLKEEKIQIESILERVVLNKTPRTLQSKKVSIPQPERTIEEDSIPELVEFEPEELEEKLEPEELQIEKQFSPPSTESKKVEVKEVGQSFIPLPAIFPAKEQESLDVLLDRNLEDAKNQKIMDEYDKKLKDVRSDLKKLIFEYNIIVEEKEKAYESKEVEVLLDKLNLIIKRIEELKKKIAVPDIEKYEDPYLYHLIEEYMKDFKDKKFVEEIKDSELYILISEKLEELDKKKDKLNSKLEDKKDKLEMDEDRLQELKKKYDDLDQFNTKLLKFQAEQDILLKDLQDKIATSMTTSEKVEVQMKVLELQSKNLLKLLALQMMIPGAKTAKKIALTTASYLYFMRRVIRPKTVAKRYRIIEVKNYSDSIEKSLDQLETTEKLLHKTSRELDRIINQVQKDYAEYLGVLPECDQLLANLEKVQDSIKEKEYELTRIKQEQQKNLEKNNEKVKLIKKEEM